jgi:hypothetical protein
MKRWLSYMTISFWMSSESRNMWCAKHALHDNVNPSYWPSRKNLISIYDMKDLVLSSAPFSLVVYWVQRTRLSYSPPHGESSSLITTEILLACRTTSLYLTYFRNVYINISCYCNAVIRDIAMVVNRCKKLDVRERWSRAEMVQ